ncbi:hypothetical protein HPP92_009872 [Vanilla planifolia]|uniref:Uncharacterized protein n=1 Tax=Vanilla planifolia TaxID=51239 RepID=A0A835RG71_VANPL|nr:hypothetical protein HPP92_009872 [Vanilla planifolia]
MSDSQLNCYLGKQIQKVGQMIFFHFLKDFLSALIMEDGTESLDCSVEQKELLSQISSDCSTYGPNCHLDSEQDSADIKHDFELNPEYRRLKNFPADENVFPEFKVTAAMLELENCNLEQFESLPLSDRILMELHSIGIYPDLVPGLAEGEDEEIDTVISRLRINLFKQVRNRRKVLYQLEKALQGVKEIQERKLEQLAMHKLLKRHIKRLGGRGSHGSSHKGGMSKISKQLALLFAKRLAANNSERYGHKSERHQFDPFQAASNLAEQQFVKTYQFSNTGKKKEVLLDDVVVSAAARTASISGSMIPIGPKWKKIDKEKDHTLVKSLGAKAGRQSLSYGRGERKPKTKPKQKIAQLSNFGNGLDRLSETNFLTSAQESLDNINNGGTRVNRTESQVNREASGLPKGMEDNIFTNLPLNGMAIDELDVADDLGGQGQDIGSWLNVDEDALQDHDLVGLEIPMDDLSELKLNF